MSPKLYSISSDEKLSVIYVFNVLQYFIYPLSSSSVAICCAVIFDFFSEHTETNRRRSYYYTCNEVFRC